MRINYNVTKLLFRLYSKSLVAVLNLNICLQIDVQRHRTRSLLMVLPAQLAIRLSLKFIPRTTRNVHRATF